MGLPLVTVVLALLSTVSAISVYAPVPVVCPSTPLVRPASGLSQNEETYRVSRKAKADQALTAWLKKTSSQFGTNNLPTLALTSSGGGYRALLSGAGVLQGLDARDSNTSTSGLYQALTYQAGLSGGGWLLSSLAGNNYPTVSYLKNNLWKDAFDDSVLDPGTLIKSGAYIKVVVDITAKKIAGFDTTVVDAYGRLLSYQLLQGFGGGVGTTLSSITGLSNFTSYNAPYPIITALGAKYWEGECVPGPNATTYEFSPYEFGSWDKDVSAFTQTKYLGSSLSGGKPTGLLCKKNYDNLGYVFGTSSNVFPAIGCIEIPTPQDKISNLFDVLVDLVTKVNSVASSNFFALYRNPFYKYQSPTGARNPANDIQAQKELRLVDGGMALQNNPIFPFLQPARKIDVIFVNDNSADANNYPNGSEILTTYVQSFNQGLTRMPFIPSVETFIAEGLDKRAVFFGCNATDDVTIVWLPNSQYTFASNTATAKLIYSQDETEKMIANGVQIASQGGDRDWGVCLGCGIMMKTGEALPAECEACFGKYCFRGS